MTVNREKLLAVKLLQAEEKLKHSKAEQKETFRKLNKITNGVVDFISKVTEIKDPYTMGHERKVAQLASAIAVNMDLSDEQIVLSHIAGVIHDVGKIAIPAEILSKPGKLNEAEFLIIKAHPLSGCEMIKPIHLPDSVNKAVFQHHERIDGSGYPIGLKGDKISLLAKILAVADVVEAMASHRPYRPALGIDAALQEISDKKNVFFDPKVVDICINLFETKSFEFC